MHLSGGKPRLFFGASSTAHAHCHVMRALARVKVNHMIEVNDLSDFVMAHLGIYCSCGPEYGRSCSIHKREGSSDESQGFTLIELLSCRDHRHLAAIRFRSSQHEGKAVSGVYEVDLRNLITEEAYSPLG